jgi:pimeloyl-ACP methyl ester carboxylesterase
VLSILRNRHNITLVASGGLREVNMTMPSTLTGLGERAHLMSRAIDLGTHSQDIIGVIRFEELSDVVLCGHSHGGMVIAGVAEQIADKVRALVYLDAFVPESGKSLFDYLPDERSEQM